MNGRGLRGYIFSRGSASLTALCAVLLACTVGVGAKGGTVPHPRDSVGADDRTEPGKNDGASAVPGTSGSALSGDVQEGGLRPTCNSAVTPNLTPRSLDLPRARIMGMPISHVRASPLSVTVMVAACGGLFLFGLQCISRRSGGRSRRRASEPARLAEELNKRLAALQAANRELEAERTRLLAQQGRVERVNRALEEAKVVAEFANKSKTEFLASMSHEIRTPMTAILGYTENLLHPELTQVERIDAIHTIRKNGRHLLQVVDDILDLSKIEAGKLEVESTRCSPGQIVSEVASLMVVWIQTKGLRFDVEYVGALPETIQTDPMRLRQILLNLLGNAVKFTEAGGIRLVARFVGAGLANPVLQFDVVDSGIGMTKAETERLFEAFVQGDNSTVRKCGGTGLGLTISMHLAELLGGRVTVESEPGKGSTFSVTIPTGSLDGIRMIEPSASPKTNRRGDEHAHAEHPAVSELTAPQTLPAGCRILVAEDSLDNQRLISFILEKAGAVVTIATNGHEAVEMVLDRTFDEDAVNRREHFDLILMDMLMPIMDGYEATRSLRRSGYTGPIIALTAHAMTGDRQKCLAVGCDDYATKPIDRAILLATISDRLEKQIPV